MYLRQVILAALVPAMAAFAQSTADVPFQVSVAANPSAGESPLNITNSGETTLISGLTLSNGNAQVSPTPGTPGNQGGDVFVLRPGPFSPVLRGDDARRLGVDAVLTFVQLGAPFELEALRSAARVAAESDRAGLEYVCEIMPVVSERFPLDDAPEAIAAAARTAAGLGAGLVKTTMPRPLAGVRDAVACGRPVIFAGGDLTNDHDKLFASVGAALEAGARGVAFGRNVWGAKDPGGVVAQLHGVIHKPVDAATSAASVPVSHALDVRSS